MDNLLRLALEAHGGLEHWRQLKEVIHVTREQWVLNE